MSSRGSPQIAGIRAVDVHVNTRVDPGPRDSARDVSTGLVHSGRMCSAFEGPARRPSGKQFPTPGDPWVCRRVAPGQHAGSPERDIPLHHIARWPPDSSCPSRTATGARSEEGVHARSTSPAVIRPERLRSRADDRRRRRGRLRWFAGQSVGRRQPASTGGHRAVISTDDTKRIAEIIRLTERRRKLGRPGNSR